MKLFKDKASLTAVSAVLSIFTVIAYHIPFFTHVLGTIEGGFNGAVITVSLALLMAALDFFFYYLLLYSGRFIGKCILAFTFIADAGTLYFIDSYEVLITDKMMGNVFNTQFSEASGFFSLTAVLYVLFLGILPCIYIFARKIDFGSFKRFLANIGASLGIVLAVAFANMQNWPWIDRNATELGSLLMPWSYTVNSFRFYAAEKKRNQKEILLPDAVVTKEGKDVCILIIGESARQDHFSLYGYERQTNPLLSSDGVTALKANAAATYTTAGVKAILDHKPTGKLYEILPNYLFRNGADVIWRTSNWGEPPVHIDTYQKVKKLKELYPEADERYDGILLAGIEDAISSSKSEKVLVVLHTNTSHGPTYNKKYPASFEAFTPVCTTVEMSKADPQELINAYDNTILYTDYLVHSAIEAVRQLQDWRSCVMYISDHGESLGEGNLYMHGVPMSIAPKEQVEIPFIIWTSSEDDTIKAFDSPVTQYHVFHSIMDFLGFDSPVYDKSLTVFE
ncbi:MAG: phosphoethanolamine--lipid A transferase EptA [Bacteroidales bacterium]|nr:phosphoethanolamine--lipid A transferase EptA [Bacteroidales bacterium]